MEQADHSTPTDQSTPPPHDAGGRPLTSMVAAGGRAMDHDAAAGAASGGILACSLVQPCGLPEWSNGAAAGAAGEFLTPAQIKRMISDNKLLFMQWIKVRPLCVRLRAVASTDCFSGRRAWISLVLPEKDADLALPHSGSPTILKVACWVFRVV